MSNENTANNESKNLENSINKDIPKSKEEIVKLLKTDVTHFNLIRASNPSWNPDLSNTNLINANLINTL